MRSLFQNLKIKNNEQLRADVYNGTISPDKFGTSERGDHDPSSFLMEAFKQC